VATATAPQGSAPERKKSLLFRNRDFALIWSGETVSLLGSEISVIALPSLAVLAFGEGALGVGLLMAMQWLPFVFLAPIIGVLTDRMRRKPLMLWANVARIVILGSLPLAWVLDVLTIQHLYVAALLKGVFDVVFQLAYQAFLTQLLPRGDFLEGNAKTQLSRSLSIVFGRSAGGALVGLLGAARAITADALSYVVSLIALLQVRTEEPAPKPSNRGMRATLADLRSGFSMTFGNRLLRYLTFMAMCGNLAVSMVLSMLIVFCYKDLGFSSTEVGIALGVGATPVLVGAFLSQKINMRLGMGATLILTNAMLAFAFLLIPLADNGGKGLALTVVMISQGIATFTTPVANVGIMSLIQKATPPEAMGRMGGVSLPLVWGANAAGPLIGAAVASIFTNSAPFITAAALALLAMTWVITGQIYRLRDEVPEDQRLVVK
jgi:predicted MFS family arabinose efflux permease